MISQGVQLASFSSPHTVTRAADLTQMVSLTQMVGKSAAWQPLESGRRRGSEVGDIHRIGRRADEGEAQGFVQMFRLGVEHCAESEPFCLGDALLRG